MDGWLYEYATPREGYDDNTNDGHGWEAGRAQCGTCTYLAAYVWPADADPGTLACPKCSARAAEPAPERETTIRALPSIN